MFVFSIRQNDRMHETFMDNRRKIGDVNASLQDTLCRDPCGPVLCTNEEIRTEKVPEGAIDAFRPLPGQRTTAAMGRFHGMALLFFQGHDVSDRHWWLRRIPYRHRGLMDVGRPGHVRPLHRYFHQPDPDPRWSLRKCSRRALPASSRLPGSRGNRTGDRGRCRTQKPLNRCTGPSSAMRT